MLRYYLPYFLVIIQIYISIGFYQFLKLKFLYFFEYL